MKKLSLLCIAALGAAVLVLGSAPSASAYPEQTCDVVVDRQTVAPGDTFTATGTVPVAVDASNHPVAPSDIHWTFAWNGTTKARTGKEVSASFTAPEVTKSRTIPLTVRATSPAGKCVRTFDITVVAAAVAGPTPDDGGGLLPNTGGPAFWLLVAALGLLLGGGGALAASRRKA